MPYKFPSDPHTILDAADSMHGTEQRGVASKAAQSGVTAEDLSGFQPDPGYEGELAVRVG